MDKKDTELKKEETKNKKEIKKQEYSVEEYAKNAENLFSTKPECDEYTCPNCEKKFSFHGSIWEYPEGALNLNDIVIEPIDSIE